MAMKAGVGTGAGDNSRVEGANACNEALTNLGSTDADVVFVYASVKYDQQEVLDGVTSVAKDTLVLGSSTAGEITNDGPHSESIVVMAFKADSMKFEMAVGSDVKADARKAGHDAAKELKKKMGDELKTLIMFVDVIAGNGSEVVRGALEVLGPHFPLVGGGSGDDANYKQTYQYANGKALSNSVVMLGLAGDFKFSVGVKHGWVPIGIPMMVTKSEGAIIHEINGQPAISIYNDYFGEEKAKELKNTTLAKLALNYPLGMHVEGSDELLLRAPFFVDDKGSITCGGEVPEGSEIRLMLGGSDEAIEAAREAATRVREQLEGTPKAIFLFNCHVRDRLFGERNKEEIQAIQDVIGKDAPLAGFYTYAEQAPLAGEVRNIEKCKSELHNETVVIFVLGE